MNQYDMLHLVGDVDHRLVCGCIRLLFDALGCIRTAAIVVCIRTRAHIWVVDDFND